MKELTVKAELNSIAESIAFFETEAEEAGMSMKSIMQMDIVIDEIMANIINYGYPEGNGTATVQTYKENSYLVVKFIDNGIPYDPLKKENPDITSSAEDRPIGGLGIFMAKKLTDKMEYRYENCCNILTVWKKLQS